MNWLKGFKQLPARNSSQLIDSFSESACASYNGIHHNILCLIHSCVFSWHLWISLLCTEEACIPFVQTFFALSKWQRQVTPYLNCRCPMHTCKIPKLYGLLERVEWTFMHLHITCTKPAALCMQGHWKIHNHMMHALALIEFVQKVQGMLEAGCMHAIQLYGTSTKLASQMHTMHGF